MTTSTIDKRERLMTVKELASLLGVSTTSVYRLVTSRAIPVYHLPRGHRFSEGDVAEFLKRRRVEAM